MFGTPDQSIAPSREQISGIHHDHSFDRCHIYESLTTLPFDLQPSSRVLKQECYATAITVQSCSNPSIGECIGGYRRL